MVSGLIFFIRNTQTTDNARNILGNSTLVKETEALTNVHECRPVDTCFGLTMSSSDSSSFSGSFSSALAAAAGAASAAGAAAAKAPGLARYSLIWKQN